MYRHILSALVRSGFEADTGINENFLTTVILVIITAVGFIKKLDVLDRLKTWSRQS